MTDMQDRLIRETFVVQVEQHEVLPSTNDRAKERAIRGPGPLPLLIVADEQTAGRGRRENRWWTGKGALAMSLLIEADQFGLSRSRSPMVALAAAVALAKTVRPLLPKHTVGLHWPNDVFVGDRKLAGILVEVPSDRLYIVGIGVNTNNTLADAPQDLRQTATTLFDLTGARLDHATFLSTLLGHLAEEFPQFDSGCERIAQAANGFCLQRGSSLTIRTGSRTATGTCIGIGSSGELLLDTAEGREEFFTGVLVHDR